MNGSSRAAQLITASTTSKHSGIGRMLRTMAWPAVVLFASSAKEQALHQLQGSRLQGVSTPHRKVALLLWGSRARAIVAN